MEHDLAKQQTAPSLPQELMIEAFVDAFEVATQLKVDDARQVEVPFSGLEGRQRLDAVMHVQGPEPFTFAAEITRQGFPRDIKNAVWQLDEYVRAQQAEDPRAQSGRPIVRLVIGQHLSPGARAVLRNRGIAHFDVSNSGLYFKHGTMLIDVTGPPAPAPRYKPSSLFTGAREQVIHALLHTRDAWFNGLDLVRMAHTSGYTVSQTLRHLENLGWVATKGGGRTAMRRLEQPGELLGAWAAAWKSRKTPSTRWFFFTPDQRRAAEAIAEQLHESDVGAWAFTGVTAGNDMAPLLTSIDVFEINIQPGEADRVATALGAKKADRGANVTLHERDGAAALFTHHGPSGRPIVSPWIAYLDLVKEERGRNKELAQHLRESVLKV
jgi:hypothetical protein